MFLLPMFATIYNLALCSYTNNMPGGNVNALEAEAAAARNRIMQPLIRPIRHHARKYFMFRILLCFTKIFQSEIKSLIFI